jgi:RES domain-containing protein
LTSYRIGDPDGAYPIFDATGSQFYPGRWNTQTTPMIYSSESYATAMLEKLVHGSGHLPPNQHYIEISIDRGLTYEVFPEASHPGWERADCAVAKAYGAVWAADARSLLLIVPSVVARMEKNFLLNPAHPEFRLVRASLHRPVWWDGRLFSPDPSA